MKSGPLLLGLALCLNTAFNRSIDAVSSEEPLKLNIQITQITPGIGITGASGPMRLEYTTNVDQASDWTLLATVHPTNSRYFYADATATNASQRFYRAAYLLSPQNVAQPQRQTLTLGDNATFTANATGAPPFTYQWQLNGSDIPKATNAIHNIANVQWVDAGNYGVIVKNSAASVASQTGALIVKAQSAPSMNPDPEHLIWINAGTFLMGSPSTEEDRLDWEGPQTRVTLSQGFWMSKYETTQEEYLAVMGKNPSYFTGELKRPVEDDGAKINRPTCVQIDGTFG